MRTIDIENVNNCINKLENWHNDLANLSIDNKLYEVYRSAIIKEFQIVINQSKQLLKKKLQQIDNVSDEDLQKFRYKDFFRRASECGLIDENLAKRWISQYYQELRNSAEHNYGILIAEKVIGFMSNFITDAKKLMEVIND